MDWPLARGEATSRDRGSVARNGRRRLVHPWIARKVEIIVARVIDAATPLDGDLGTGDAVADTEIGVRESGAEERGLSALHHEVGRITVESAEIVRDCLVSQLRRLELRIEVGRTRQRGGGSSRKHRASPCVINGRIKSFRFISATILALPCCWEGRLPCCRQRF